MAKSKIEKHSLSPDELKEKMNYLTDNKKQFRVFYGFARLTKKIVRKKELAVYYENGSCNSNDKFIQQKIHIVHVRMQTLQEMLYLLVDAKNLIIYHAYYISSC